MPNVLIRKHRNLEVPSQFTEKTFPRNDSSPKRQFLECDNSSKRLFTENVKTEEMEGAFVKGKLVKG